jgi:hypothetical protein
MYDECQIIFTSWIDFVGPLPFSNQTLPWYGWHGDTYDELVIDG